MIHIDNRELCEISMFCALKSGLNVHWFLLKFSKDVTRLDKSLLNELNRAKYALVFIRRH